MAFTLIDSIFFFYMFVGTYMFFLLLFIYLSNRKTLFSYPKGTPVPISIIVPCYNDAEHIGGTIEALLALDYPKHLIEIIVVDDCSKDSSAAVVRSYTQKYANVRLIVNTRNSGGAAEPTNIGIKAAKHALIAVADADSAPERDALRKMIGFLQEDPLVAAVTCSVLAQKPVKFIQKLQSIEYMMIAWSRKLLDCVDAVYVTPGPFAVYRKDLLEKVGMFDTKNLTQDIEIVWRLRSRGYRARMCLDAAVYSATPDRFGAWFKQRVRWNVGGTQTLLKYKSLFFKQGMLGAFILPFFSFSLFLGLLGLGLFLYLVFRRILVFYLTSMYSLYADTTLIRLQDLTFSPSILNFFGFSLFIAGAAFTFMGLGIMRSKRIHQHNIFNVFFYLLVYLTVYPFIMVRALYQLSRKTYSW